MWSVNYFVRQVCHQERLSVADDGQDDLKNPERQRRLGVKNGVPVDARIYSEVFGRHSVPARSIPATRTIFFNN